MNVVSAIAEEGYIPSNELLQMDVTIEALVDTSSLNDMYLPFNRTLAKVNTALESAKTFRYSNFMRILYRSELFHNLAPRTIAK